MNGNLFPHQTFKRWFLGHRRDLPWRRDLSPYHVWISEVMLQQTQVAVVLPYFERWMAQFPTIERLAQASREEVLKCWEGLGYYSRARNLHEAAHYLVKHCNGELPREEKELAKIKGLGPYTIGAIRSFAFHEKAAAVDGNVLRVLSRFFAIEEEIDRSATQKRLRTLAEALLPDKEPWLVSEGLIELGATVCTKKPQCTLCPLLENCRGYQRGLASSLPNRRPRQKTIQLHRHVAVIISNESYLVQKREKGAVMADLYEFPYLENASDIPVATAFQKHLGMKLTYERPIEEEKHSFTRYRVRLSPHLFAAERCDPRYQWRTAKALRSLPFSSGHKRILHRIFDT